MYLSTFHVAHLPHDLAVYVALYQDLKNATFLRQQLLQGNADYEYAFLDATSILSSTHLLASVFRAVNDKENKRMKSRNVHSEMVFALSPNNNIADSFRNFGITDKTTELLAVKLVKGSEVNSDDVSRHLSRIIEGTPIGLSDTDLGRFADMVKIKKIYKLNSPRKGVTQHGSREGRQVEPSDGGVAERRELEVAILGLMALRGAT